MLLLKNHIKHILLSILFTLGTILLSTSNINAQIAEAHFDYAPFYSRTSGTYVETYIKIPNKSLNYVITEDNTLEASVEVIMVFKNIDKIKEYRRFNIVSPTLPDTALFLPDLIDLQRISIPEGIYNFDLIITFLVLFRPKL